MQGTMEHVLSNYAQICCDGNEQLAALELKRQLRDRLVYERYLIPAAREKATLGYSLACAG